MTPLPLASALTPAEILRERARALAARSDAEPADAQAGELLEILEFTLAGERYAVESSRVRGIHPLQGMVPLPCAPDCVLGMLNVRGQVVPVLGLRSMMGLHGEGGITSVVLVHDADAECGLPVEGPATVRRIASASLQPGLPGLADTARRCISGITADGITLLDVAGIFSHPRLVVAEDAGGITNIEPMEEKR